MKKMPVANESLLPEVEKLLAEGLHVTLKVKGNSMLPFIRGGRDSVTLEAPAGISRGDIVLARIGKERYVLHRIIGTKGNTVILMGDGNCHGTEQCLRSDICGRVITIVKPHKYISTDSSCMHMAGTVWRLLLPVRRWLLALYKRTIIDK
mgnify:FL=1